MTALRLALPKHGDPWSASRCCRGALGARLDDLRGAGFLNTDVMLAGVAVIGIIGLALEKLVFQKLEDQTVVRWGMMTS